MAVELELVLRFEDSAAVPSREDLEADLDCIILHYQEEET